MSKPSNRIEGCQGRLIIDDEDGIDLQVLSARLVRLIPLQEFKYGSFGLGRSGRARDNAK